MAETRRRFDPEFRDGAVRIVRETRKSIAQVARDLGINDGTLANWVTKATPSARGSRAVARSTTRRLVSACSCMRARLSVSCWVLEVSPAHGAAVLLGRTKPWTRSQAGILHGP